MIGEVFIKDLTVRAKIGITPEERAFPQDLILNVLIQVNATKALESDNVTDTLDYFSLHQRICIAVENSGFNLLESLANFISNICLENVFAQRVKITIEKPNILTGAKSAGFSLTKEK